MSECIRCGECADYGEVRACGQDTVLLCAPCARACEIAEEAAREGALARFIEESLAMAGRRALKEKP